MKCTDFVFHIEREETIINGTPMYYWMLSLIDDMDASKNHHFVADGFAASVDEATYQATDTCKKNVKNYPFSLLQANKAEKSEDDIYGYPENIMILDRDKVIYKGSLRLFCKSTDDSIYNIRKDVLNRFIKWKQNIDDICIVYLEDENIDDNSFEPIASYLFNHILEG